MPSDETERWVELSGKLFVQALIDNKAVGSVGATLYSETLIEDDDEDEAYRCLRLSIAGMLRSLDADARSMFKANGLRLWFNGQSLGFTSPDPMTEDQSEALASTLLKIARGLPV